MYDVQMYDIQTKSVRTLMIDLGKKMGSARMPIPFLLQLTQ